MITPGEKEERDLKRKQTKIHNIQPSVPRIDDDDNKHKNKTQEKRDEKA